MRDTTGNGILSTRKRARSDSGAAVDDEVVSDLDELGRVMGIASPQARGAKRQREGADEDLESVMSDLTDLDELERIMGHASGAPVKRPGKPWTQLNRSQQLSQVFMGLNRTARKVVDTAQKGENTTVFGFFNLEHSVKHGKDKKAFGTIVFDGDCARRAVSQDNYDLVYHLPGAFRGRTLDDFTEGAFRWASVAPITANGKGDFQAAYRDGTYVGQTQLCQFWHATGHKNKDAQVGYQMRQTGPSFRGAFRAMNDFAPIAAFCTTVLKEIDPLQHTLLWDVRERRMKNENWAEQPIFKAYNPTLLWECCEVVYNRWSPPHFDRNDPDMSWAAIVYFGTFVRPPMFAMQPVGHLFWKAYLGQSTPHLPPPLQVERGRMD
uniref:Autotransporter adhesin n=1 Tax=Ganoderma boninense TaxID=34458 RepID=A0A5K1K8H6_9APHY|nr:Autotransporter adhesin [Ganoderma boninense]